MLIILHSLTPLKLPPLELDCLAAEVLIAGTPRGADLGEFQCRSIYSASPDLAIGLWANRAFLTHSSKRPNS